MDLNLSLIIVCLPSLRPYITLYNKTTSDESAPSVSQIRASPRRRTPDDITLSGVDETGAKDEMEMHVASENETV
jgi:hypothetical protein